MAPNNKSLVLVTGATGHLGFRTLVLALQAGYRARVVYRSESSLAKVKGAASIKPFIDDLEYAHVPDMTVDGAFDKAVKGVDFFLHIASPIFDTSEAGGEVRDWQKEFYHPALQGTVVALASALKEPNIKRVVITSSVVAVEAKNGASLAGPNDVKPLPDKETLTNFTVPAHAYVYSKVMAHRAVDDWIKEHPKAHFDVVRVLPGYIQGANELAQNTKEAAVGSNEGTFNVALGNLLSGPKPTAQIYLDDIAETHVVALDKQKVDGGKALISVANDGKGWVWDDFVPVVERLFPDEVKNGILKPHKGQEGGEVAFDVYETVKVLGHDFAGIETMVRSVVEQYLRLKGNEGTA
ncbi:hypothetical protein LTR78_002839 [Recurvomyces mirabilis]|uniref:NAD-dependent epimerase/dehydratase domain-containing protein n=1 Tax=Recurvomyces mirabilis TaxID=574656 RepID=A0AAE1C404_9PEZI|nr:hypothetical protein LTR78_002839 [Recurvomyces mirabilis]KAK5159428.1 hypothetical protein LTS14_002570 [Recurvomyces mirabilis]